MKLGLLAVLLSGAIFAPSALRSEEPEPENPFDQRLIEMIQSNDEALDTVGHAHAQWKETGDLDTYAAAIDEYLETSERLQPSKLDLWEGRQRLIELIYDSDDRVVFELYLYATVRKRERAKTQEEIEELRIRMDRTEQNQASRGVSLTPEN